MNLELLNTDIQNFIFEKLNADTVTLLLRKPIFKGISNKELVEQLEARKKSEQKLPTWFGTPKICYPNKRNIEQTSSEITANYKAEIVEGKSLVDATGGLGVDSFFFSRKIDKVFHCEINENLSKIASHNFTVLGVRNIETIASDGMMFLKDSKFDFDWIYIDPSRRDASKRKVFQLEDCSPNVLAHLELLFSKSENILLKTSPLLDLSAGMKQLKNTKEIHIVAVDNEVKELLWVLEKGYLGEVVIKTINLNKLRNQSFEFFVDAERLSQSTYSEPLYYLYEPNAAIMKSGGFKILGNRLELKKLHEHTHLYTSNELIDFPGRVFKIEKVIPYSKSTMKKLGIVKANISVRNFTETVADVRKKYRIQEGGNIYLFFVKDSHDKKMVLSCSKPN